MLPLHQSIKSPLLRQKLVCSQLNCVRRLHPTIDATPAPLVFPSFNPSVRWTLPTITSIIPVVTGIWDTILRAVPKRKTTHSRKRKRQLVGKALPDKKNLTRCEACGDWRLLHTLCGSCIKSIQKDWRNRERLEQP